MEKREQYIVSFDGEIERYDARVDAEAAIADALKNGDDQDYIEVTRGVELDWDYDVRIRG